MKPIPQAVYDRAEILARSHPLGVVAELLGKPNSTITRMKQRGWKAADYSCQLRPVPTDFAIQARTMTNEELCIHYRAGAPAVRRWLREKPVRPPFKPIPWGRRK